MCNVLLYLVCLFYALYLDWHCEFVHFLPFFLFMHHCIYNFFIVIEIFVYFNSFCIPICMYFIISYPGTYVLIKLFVIWFWVLVTFPLIPCALISWVLTFHVFHFIAITSIVVIGKLSRIFSSLELFLLPFVLFLSFFWFVQWIQREFQFRHFLPCLVARAMKCFNYLHSILTERNV